MDGAVLLRLLAEGEQKLHLVPGLQIRELAGPGQRVHVEEDVLTPALTGVGDEPVLREGGREGGRRVLLYMFLIFKLFKLCAVTGCVASGSFRVLVLWAPV